MKILQIGSSLHHSGGIEKYILQLSHGLQQIGHDVHISAPPGSWLLRRAKELGITVHSLRIWHQHDLFGLNPHRKLFRTEQFDVVNAHFSRDYLVPTLAARLEKQKGIVITRHMCHCWPHLRRWMYGTLLSDHIIGVSQAVGKAMREGGIHASRLSVVLSGIDTPPDVLPVQLSEELKLPADTVYIGVVSRLVVEKGHLFLLKAMLQTDCRVCCLIVGEGEERKRLEQFTRENGLAERVKFMGWRDDSDAIMRALDIVIVPSLWEEACSLSLLEAMAASRPLIVTLSGGNAELVSDKVNGILVNKNDVPALANAINLLAENKSLREKMGVSGFDRQRKLFTLERMVRDTERVYTKLIQTKTEVGE